MTFPTKIPSKTEFILTLCTVPRRLLPEMCIRDRSYRGKSADVEFAYSVDWQYNVGDYAMVMTKSYVAYLPDDYDGLVFAAEAQTDNFKDYEKRKQGDSIYPEARIMDIDLIDTESALFFDLCADWRYKL